MAVVQFGEIITAVVGSIRGDTYRRYRGGTVLQRRSAGPPLAVLLRNKKLPQLISVINMWTVMSLANRNAWTAASQFFTYPDKFGNPKILTGREFFIKICNHNINVGLPCPNPNDITNSVPDQGNLVVFLDICNDVEVWTTAATNTMYGAVSLKPLPNEVANPDRNGSALIKPGQLLTPAGINFSLAFKKRYGYAVEGDWFGLWLDTYNQFGVQGKTYSQVSQVICT